MNRSREYAGVLESTATTTVEITIAASDEGCRTKITKYVHWLRYSFAVSVEIGVGSARLSIGAATATEATVSKTNGIIDSCMAC